MIFLFKRFLSYFLQVGTSVSNQNLVKTKLPWQPKFTESKVCSTLLTSNAVFYQWFLKSYISFRWVIQGTWLEALMQSLIKLTNPLLAARNFFLNQGLFKYHHTEQHPKTLKPSSVSDFFLSRKSKIKNHKSIHEKGWLRISYVSTVWRPKDHLIFI